MTHRWSLLYKHLTYLLVVRDLKFLLDVVSIALVFVYVIRHPYTPPGI